MGFEGPRARPLGVCPRGLESRRAQTSAAARPRAGPRDSGALRHGVRQRRLVDLLRARRHGGDRARPDAARLRHLRADLRRHRGDLRRGHGALPGGGGVGLVRAPRVQRARLVRGRLGADAQLHHHDRHLGVLRPALPLHLLGAPEDEPVGRDRRRRRRRLPRGAEHHRDQGGRGPQHRPRGHRLCDADPARPAGLRAHLQPAHAHHERALGRRADVERLRARDPGRDDRLHGNRDRLEPR